MTDFDDDPELEPVAASGRRGKKDRARPPLRAVGDETERSLDYELAWRDMSDSGNGERLIARFPGLLMHVREKQRKDRPNWFAWDGVYWNGDFGEDLALGIAGKVKDAIKAEARALEKGGGPDLRVDQLFRFAQVSGNIGKLHSMLEAAAPALRKSLSEIDARPDLLYTADAVISLPRYEIRDREPGDDGEELPAAAEVAREAAHYTTKLCEARYDPAARAPLFEKFLGEIFPDPELRRFVQRAAGYSATGDVSEEAFFLCWGRGRNGKGTFLRTIQKAIGSYAATIPVELLLRQANVKTGNEASPQFAVLTGVRLALTTEPPPGAMFDEGVLRTLTGRDRFPIRDNYGQPFYLDPQFKIWIACNDKPSVRSASEAFWRRVRLIPFTANIPEEATDPRLEEKLRAELPGVLNWLIEGARMWARDGLAPPEAVRAANESYRDEMDPLNRFLTQCTELKIGKDTARANLWWVYLGWCEDMGEAPLTGTAFGKALINKGYKRKMANGTWYRDVEIRPEPFTQYLDKGKEIEAQTKGKRG